MVSHGLQKRISRAVGCRKPKGRYERSTDRLTGVTRCCETKARSYEIQRSRLKDRGAPTSRGDFLYSLYCLKGGSSRKAKLVWASSRAYPSKGLERRPRPPG